MPSDRPNFLIFCVDQMQSFSLPCNGNTEVKTPALDRLAADGVTFRRAYCNNSVCMPSRSTMITGLTPRQHGCLTNGNNLPESVPTITQALVDAGYRTHSVGKLHLQAFTAGAASWEDRTRWLNGDITSLPEGYYGFQTTELVGAHVSGCFGDYVNDLSREHPDIRRRYQRDNAARVCEDNGQCWQMDLPAELHYNHWIGDKSIDFIEREGDAPFFLWCSFPDPHFPFAAAAPYSTMYDPATLAVSPTWQRPDNPSSFLAVRRGVSAGRFGERYTERMLQECTAQMYGMISHVDANIARVLDALEAAGRMENTVVAFIADHGEYLGAHQLLYKDAWAYEELVRVPFIWRAPGGCAAEASDELVSMLDFAPTVLDYAGIDPAVLDTRKVGSAQRDVLPGRSLRARVTDGTALEDRPALIEYDEDFFDGHVCHSRVVVTERFKLGVYEGVEDGYLFDLRDDPHETINLWQHPACAGVRADLTRTLLDQLIRTDRFDTERHCGA